MGNRDVVIEEMLGMISDIHSSLDGLEKAYGLAVNTERCKLWAEQYKMVNQAQEALEAVEVSLNQSPVQQSTIKVENIVNKISATPHLGY